MDPEIQKHIFKTIEVIQPGEAIEDYMNERVAYLYYAYDDQNEMIETVRHMNERITIDFMDGGKA